MEIVARFTGEAAEAEVLPAFEGSQSIEGLARALTLVTHYAWTGTVRKRYPYVGSPEVLLLPPERGSFLSIFSFLTDPQNALVTTAFGTISVGVISTFIADLLKLATRRLVGRDHEPDTDMLRNLLRQRPGEVEALSEGVEPSLKKAHTVINNGASQINVITGDNNIVSLNARTKEYMNSSVLDQRLNRKSVTVGMLNANTRNGRVFDAELGRTVPIHIPRQAAPETIPNLATSLQSYSARQLRRANSELIITFQTERAPDDTIKRYIVFNAQFEGL